MKRALFPLRRRFSVLVNELDDPRREAALCASCGRFVRGISYHVGFSDIVDLYCSTCDSVLLVDLYHTALSDLHAWAEQNAKGFGFAPANLWREFEAQFRPCACGGHFAYLNPPRCPHCHGLLRGDCYAGEAARKVQDGYVFVPGLSYDGREHGEGAA